MSHFKSVTCHTFSTQPPGAAAGGAGVAAGDLPPSLAACFLEDSRRAPRRRRRRAPAAGGLGDLCQRGADNPHEFIFWRIRFDILEDSQTNGTKTELTSSASFRSLILSFFLSSFALAFLCLAPCE